MENSTDAGGGGWLLGAGGGEGDCSRRQVTERQRCSCTGVTTASHKYTKTTQLYTLKEQIPCEYINVKYFEGKNGGVGSAKRASKAHPSRAHGPSRVCITPGPLLAPTAQVGGSLAPGGHSVPRGQKSECPRTTAELALEEAWQQVGKNGACTGTALLSQPGQGRGKGRPVSKGQSLSPGNGSGPP